MAEKVQKGDVIKIDFVGKVKETGEVFDTTKEEVAKEANIYNEKNKYKPISVVVGEEMLVKGLDEAIEGKEVGETFTVEVPPEKGFGKRDPKLITTVSEAELRSANIVPKVGQAIRIGNNVGRIVAISGGRVTIDFNHPLAGKTLVYEVTIVSKAKDDKEKAEYLTEFVFGDVDKIEIEVDGNVVKLKFNEEMSKDPLTVTRCMVLKEFLGKAIKDVKLNINLTI